MRIPCIAKIKDVEDITLIPVAEEIQSILGVGGNPDPEAILEERVGFVNTQVSNGYFRTSFDPAYATALQWIKDNGGAETVELISIEWDGQEMFQTGVDAEDNPEWLGLIGSLPMKQIEEIEP